MDLEKYKKSYQEIEKLQQTKNLTITATPRGTTSNRSKSWEISITLVTRRSAPTLSTRETASSCSTVAFSTAST